MAETGFSVGALIKALTDSFTGFLSGTGAGIVDFFETLFINAEGGMTVFAVVSIAFIGLGLATAVSRMIFKMVKR